MRTIIHDLEEKEIKKIKFKKDDILISSLKCQNSCIGCFSCWTKHPMECTIKDNFSNIVEKLKKSSELVIITKNRYGCYSNSVKKVLERCIGYMLPYFTIREGKIHHQSRFDNKLLLSIYVYGILDKDDKKSFEELVKANAINFNSEEYKIKYFDDKEEIKCIH